MEKVLMPNEFALFGCTTRRAYFPGEARLDAEKYCDGSCRLTAETNRDWEECKEPGQAGCPDVEKWLQAEKERTEKKELEEAERKHKKELEEAYGFSKVQWTCRMIWGTCTHIWTECFCEEDSAEACASAEKIGCFCMTDRRDIPQESVLMPNEVGPNSKCTFMPLEELAAWKYCTYGSCLLNDFPPMDAANAGWKDCKVDFSDICREHKKYLRYRDRR